MLLQRTTSVTASICSPVLGKQFATETHACDDKDSMSTDQLQARVDDSCISCSDHKAMTLVTVSASGTARARWYNAASSGGIL